MSISIPKLLKRLVATLLVALTTLLVLELGARLMADLLGISPYMRYDAGLGWVASSGATKKHRDRAMQFDVTYRINAHGYRGPEYPLAKGADKLRIVILGDSTGFGWGVEQEQTLAGILDRELEDTEVFNLAVSGYGTDQSYLRFMREGIALEPDFVILQVSPNDFEEIMHPFFNQKAKPYFRQSESGGLELANVPAKSNGARAKAYFDNSLPVPFKEWLGWNSYAFNVLNEAYYQMRRKALLPAADDPGVFNRDSVLRFNQIARMLFARIEKSGAHGVLVHAVKEISENRYIPDEDIRVIDLYSTMLQSGKDGPAAYFFSDGYHWNPAGHRLAADELKRFIMDARDCDL